MDSNARFIRSGDESIYLAATGLAQNKNSVSTSLLQRRYGIGYGRAARIMDQLRADGLIAEQVPQRERIEAGSRLLFEQNSSVVDDLLLNAGFRPRVVETEIRTRIMEIGPDEAKALLAANYQNRKIRQNVVLKYARLMSEGKWLPTHQGIAFAKNGRGIDLQHRLLAVIKSGCTVQLMVSEGLDEKVFEVIDKHSSRSTADSIGADSKHVSIAHFLLRISKGQATNKYTDDDIRDYISIFQEELDSVSAAKIKSVKLVTSVPVKAALVLQMALMPKHAAAMIQKMRDFSNQNTKNFTPAMYAFASAIFAKRLNATSSDARIEMFAKACKIFDPKYAAVTKLITDEAFVILIKSRLADLVSERSNLVI